MKVFVVALPLFASDMSVEAYRLCDRSGDKALSVKNDYRFISEVLLSPGLDLIKKVGLEPFTGDKPLFVDVNRFLLLTGVPTNMDIDPSMLIVTLPGGTPAEPELLYQCEKLREMGYTLALDGFPLNGVQSPFFQYASYLILDYKNPRFTLCYKAVTNELPNVTIVMSNVPDMATFEEFGAHGTGLFTGDFYNQPITRGSGQIAPVKVNALQLLRNVNEEDFDLQEIAKIIERDPSLSISLLRFLNSGAAGAGRKVDSIRSAVAIIGQQEVRRWATVAISVSLAEDRPSEITKLSLVRAKFAENLAPHLELGVFQPALFITGLFSLLDVILQKPMAEALNEVSVDERVRKALLDRDGDFYRVMELIYTYERGDWDKVSILIIRNGTTVEAVSEAFVDALVWYEQLLKSIDSSADEQAAQEA